MSELPSLKKYYHKMKGDTNFKAQKIHDIMKKLGLSNEEMGKSLGISWFTIYRIMFYWAKATDKLKEWIQENDIGVYLSWIFAVIENAEKIENIPSNIKQEYAQKIWDPDFRYPPWLPKWTSDKIEVRFRRPIPLKKSLIPSNTDKEASP